MLRRATLPAVVAGAALLLAGIVSLTRGDAPERAPAVDLHGISCRPAPGAAARFRARISVESAGGGSSSVSTESFTAALTAEHAAAGVALRLDALVDESGTIGEDGAEGSIWLVEMRQGCAGARLGVDRDVPARVQALMRGLVQALAVPLDPPLDQRSRWEGSMVDGLGTYRAAFTRSDLEVRRNRLGYERAFGAPHVAIRDSRGESTFLFHGRGWLDRARVRDEAVLDMLGMHTSIALTIEVDREGATDPFAVPPASDFRWDNLDEPPRATGVAERAPARTSSVDVDAVRDSPSAELGLELGARMRSEPTLVEEARDALVSDAPLPIDTMSALFMALGVAETTRAQDILCDLATGNGDLGQRLHAVVALHDVRHPTARTRSTIVRLATGDLTMPVERAALMALASWAGRTDPQLMVEGAAERFDELAPSVIAADPLLGLAAIGNHGGLAWESRVRESLGDARPELRRAALDAMRRWPAEREAALIAAHLQSEPVPDLRVQMLERVAVLTSRGADPSTTIDLARSLLANDRDAAVRTAAVDVLGARAASEPSVRATLIEHFASERDMEVRRRIGAHVSARDLAATQGASE